MTELQKYCVETGGSIGLYFCKTIFYIKWIMLYTGNDKLQLHFHTLHLQYICLFIRVNWFEKPWILHTTRKDYACCCVCLSVYKANGVQVDDATNYLPVSYYYYWIDNIIWCKFRKLRLCYAPCQTSQTSHNQLNRANNEKEIEKKTHSIEEACPKRKLYLITTSKHKQRWNMKEKPEKSLIKMFYSLRTELATPCVTLIFIRRHRIFFNSHICFYLPCNAECVALLRVCPSTRHLIRATYKMDYKKNESIVYFIEHDIE